MKVSCKYCNKKYHSQGMHKHLIACLKNRIGPVAVNPGPVVGYYIAGHVVDKLWNRLSLEEKIQTLSKRDDGQVPVKS